MELKEALGQLDEKYRIVMVLYYSEGYQTGEIAELLEIPRSTVPVSYTHLRFEKVSGLIGLWGPLGVDIYPYAFLKRMIPE